MSSTPPPLIIKNRWLGFLIWQSITSISIYLLLSLSSSTFSLLPLLFFSLSLLLFSLSLFLLSSPYPHPSASPSLLLSSLLKFILGGFSLPPDPRRRLAQTLAALSFLILCGASGFLGVVASCARWGDGWWRLVGVGLRGLVLGLVFGVDFVWRQRWVFSFQIIQRPLFYCLKRGLLSSIKQALRLSTVAFISSTVLTIFLPDQFKRKHTMGQNVIQLVYFYIGASAVCICWELSHHLLQLLTHLDMYACPITQITLHHVVHTRRCSFAPALGSAAAETNPSEWLLEALEQSTPRSLLQYLAYLDLCMVCESNVEPWRRAAFYEETGETYRRIVSVCLRPLEQLTSRISEGLVGISLDKSELLALQLNSPDTHVDSKLHEAFSDLQICMWCSRTVSALTARSHTEDRYGVAQLTGCNIAVVSTLLSTLVAVEACLGKRTNPQPAHLMGPANIRWATANTGRKDLLAAVLTKGGDGLYTKAYTMADILRTSVYEIVSAFQADMQTNAEASVLEKNWIADGKPLYSTREIVVQKLLFFVDFRAN